VEEDARGGVLYEGVERPLVGDPRAARRGERGGGLGLADRSPVLGAARRGQGVPCGSDVGLRAGRGRGGEGGAGLLELDAGDGRPVGEGLGGGACLRAPCVVLGLEHALGGRQARSQGRSREVEEDVEQAGGQAGPGLGAEEDRVRAGGRVHRGEVGGPSVTLDVADPPAADPGIGPQRLQPEAAEHLRLDRALPVRVVAGLVEHGAAAGPVVGGGEVVRVPQ
jgi:hypothetical protein